MLLLMLLMLLLMLLMVCACRSISRVVLDALPMLYNTTKGEDTIVQFVHCLADLNHYYNVKNTLLLGKSINLL